ncbi:Testis-expressed sequence 10 protein [Thoreauomyces humboldtii]|nr:Testis-expressed sequence 10 protein [Thoreauomyces humboldtii]
MVASDTKVEATIRNTYELNDCDELKAFIDVLMPTLVDLWLESQPSAFTPGSIALTPALAVMHTILKMMNLLWRSILVEFKDRVPRSWVAGWLKVITKHFMIHFPFGTGNFSVRDRQVDVTLQDRNILFCELLSHVILSGTDAGEEASSEWRDTMLDYMLDMFDGERESRKKNDGTVIVFSTQQLEATFPVVWSLLNTLDDEISAEFLKAVCDKSNTLWGTLSAIVSFEFLSRLLKTQNNPGDRSSLLVTDVMRDWLLLLPKRLWQLKATNPVFSQSILEVMIYTLKNNPGGFAQDSAVAAGFEAAIKPFFHVETAKGAIFGPFVMLPEPVQICAVTFLYYLPSWPEKLVRGYAECLSAAVCP